MDYPRIVVPVKIDEGARVHTTGPCVHTRGLLADQTDLGGLRRGALAAVRAQRMARRVETWAALSEKWVDAGARR